MDRISWLAIAVLVVLASCKRGAEPPEASTPGEAIDAVGEAAPEPGASSPDWLAIWSSLGVTVDRGAVDRIDDKFLRVVEAGGDRAGLIEHYQAQVVAAAWVLGETEQIDAHLRVDLTRDHLMLTLIAQDQEGGAFVGLSVHQDWRAMEFPLDGASQTLAQANRFHVTYLEGKTSAGLAGEIGVHLTDALGWARDRDEPLDAPEGVVDPLATWYVHGRRTIRVQTHAQTDGAVQLTMRAGWR